MGMYDDDEDYDTDLVKKLRQQIKEQGKALAERDTKLQELEQANTQRIIADVFTAKGVNPRLAKLALSEVDEVSDQSLAAWIDANSDITGVQPAPAAQVDAQQQAAYQQQSDSLNRMAAVEQSGVQPVMMNDLAQIEAMSPEELMGMLRGGR